MRKFSIISVSMLCLIMLGTLVIVSGCEKKAEPEPTVKKVETKTAESKVEEAKSELETKTADATKVCPVGCTCAKCQAMKAAEAEIEKAKSELEAKAAEEAAKVAEKAKAELEAKAAEEAAKVTEEAEKKAEELKESAGSLPPTK